MAEKLKIAKGNIGNALHSTAKDHVTTFVDEVFDEDKQKYQSDINDELDKKLNRNILAIEFDDSTGELNAILGQDTTIKSVETDEDGNVIIEQEII